MHRRQFLILSSCSAAGAILSACGSALVSSTGRTNGLKVVATTSFLADIAKNVVGPRATVESLIPPGLDPHGFEPTPADLRTVADSDVLIVNGHGLEEFLERLIQSAEGDYLLIEASEGLTPRLPRPGEGSCRGHHHHDEDHDHHDEDHDHHDEDRDHHDEDHDHHDHHSHGEEDPHFWLDPVLAIKYVENIRDGLSQADPQGAEVFAANAQAYIAELRDLDSWIVQKVQALPEERRLIVTDHHSFGYFADRYGFRVIGALVPSVSPGAAPSARQMADLADQIRQVSAVAIFLETGANPQLAQQLASETGVKVVTEIYTHSIGSATGPQSYIEMMRHNVDTIVDSLK